MRPHDVRTKKLKSLENIIAGDRKYLDDCLILRSAKLLVIYDDLHSYIVCDKLVPRTECVKQRKDRYLL